MLKNVFTWQFAKYAGNLSSYLKVISDAHRLGRSDEGMRQIQLRRPFPCQIRFRCNTSDIAVIREVFVDQVYDVDLPSAPRVILDFGANIGLASLYFARKYPDATIHAFEPVRQNYALLQSQCALNGLDNVQGHAFGLGDRDQQITLSMDKGGLYGGLHQTAPGDRSGNSFDVPIRDVRAVLAGLGITSIDLLKIDVEGAEYEILRALEDRMATIRCLVGDFHAVDGDADRLWSLVEFLRRTHVVDVEKVFHNNCLLVRAWSRSWLNEVRPGWKAICQGLE